MIEVIPRNDEREHSNGIACWCEPKVVWKSDDSDEIWPSAPLVIHNALDMREETERLTNSYVEDRDWAVIINGNEYSNDRFPITYSPAEDQ